jgi:hypothetical protein
VSEHGFTDVPMGKKGTLPHDGRFTYFFVFLSKIPIGNRGNHPR